MSLRNIVNKIFRLGSQTTATSTTRTLSSIERRRQEDIQKLAALIPNPRNPSETSPEHQTNTTTTTTTCIHERVSTHALQQTLHLLAQIQTNHTPDHQLSIQNSLVGDSSGDGLFLEKGTLHPGSVVALYPGTALFHEEISFFGGVHHMFPEDEEMDWFIHRSDGVVIDGLGKTHELNAIGGGGNMASSDGGDTEGHALAEMMDKLTLLQTQGTSCMPDQTLSNPFAIAHKANHPPQGIPANVVAVAIDYCFSTMNPQLFPYIPTRHAILPNVLCEQGITFVASRVIEAGDEIYLDYATSKESRPEWYNDAVRT